MQGGFPPGGGGPFGGSGGQNPYGAPPGQGSPTAQEPAGYGPPIGGGHGLPANPAGFPPAAPPMPSYPNGGGFVPPPGTAIQTPGAPYGVHPRLGIPYSDKQKAIAGLLQLFLGYFGIGRFYTGHTGLAVAQLVVCMVLPTVITMVTCGIGVFSYAAMLWPLIDGILLLVQDSTDSEGRLLR
ncbi:MAG: TM2 domain-containing protein [Polyangiaceae bacterium]|nr:TM2 domain-containing protein [Polyangiaceae bacterium]